MRLRQAIQFLCVLVLFATYAIGADDRVLMSASLDADASRAWAIYRNTQQEHLLVFIPPRDELPDIRYEPAQPGLVQAVRPLGRKLPVSIAALNDRVYLAYPPVYANERRLMRVYSLSLTPSPVGGVWVASSADRFDTEPAIVTNGSLIGMQGTSSAVWALIEHENRVTLSVLDRLDWQSVDLPESINTTRLELTAIGKHPVLIDRSGLRFVAHEFDPETGAWSEFPESIELSDAIRITAGTRALSVLDEQEPGKARLRSWSPTGLFEIASGLDLPDSASIGALSSSSALIAISIDRETAEGALEQPPASIEILELGLLDGAERYRGAPIATTPVSPEEFRFLVGMMMLIMMGVLIVVIMPDHSSAMHLPEGVVLADPGRRLIATMLDAVLVTAVVGRLVDVSAADILTLTVIMRPDNAWSVFPLVIITGLMYSTMTEALFGATPAKMLVGIRVVRAQPGAPMRPRLWSALVRNGIKWLLPPVAALALIDPETLHRGDRAARTLVVMPRPAQPDPRDSDEG